MRKMKGKMSKDKTVRRVLEYENFTRVRGLPSEYSTTQLCSTETLENHQHVCVSILLFAYASISVRH
jgi:hypothetical protein